MDKLRLLELLEDMLENIPLTDISSLAMRVRAEIKAIRNELAK